MGYSLELIKCNGETSPQLYVCQIADHGVDLEANINYISHEHPFIIILC